MATKHKTSVDYKREYRKLLDKTKVMQKQFIVRATELIKLYPDVVYIKYHFEGQPSMTVRHYQQYYKMTPAIALRIIELIEAEIK